MYFSENFGNTGVANCIGQATAPTFSMTFSMQSARWCGGMNHGLLDPQIFTDTNGSNYLLYSEQWGCNGLGQGCNSKIWMQPLSANGLSFVGSAFMILSYADAETIPGNTTIANLGVVENPAMVADPDNGYDLTFSLGQWNYSATDDVTGEVGCSSIVPPSTCGGHLNLGDQILADGGASMGSDGTPASNWMVYHRWDPFNSGMGIRDDYAGSTAIINCNAGNC
jgi:hypothetical protein